ncbi:uncharacterized protein C20orf96 homolog isoform X2 [Carettochelys insculpta]|uniref:uncharacterized protein C20orf96 homolog isoform X2 n=1 Tax=Carettochelys insculpta TaxID=44489 RepID=UPI003EB90880
MAAKVLPILSQNITNRCETVVRITASGRGQKQKRRNQQHTNQLCHLSHHREGTREAKGALLATRKTGGQKTSAKETDLTTVLENIKVIKKLTKSKRESLVELQHHSATLLETNRRLAQSIQQTDASTAKHARDLLQQYEIFGTLLSTLCDSSQNQVGVARAELQETEKMVEKNLSKLTHEVDHMNTKVQELQEELNVLRTYMDKEYPVKAIQIGSLLRSLRNLREEQQDEMDDLEDLAKTAMQQLRKKVQDEKEQILQAVAEDKVFRGLAGLKQMTLNNQILKKEVQMQKKIIRELLEEITELRKSIVNLRGSVRDPREVIFADVLLRRPKCLPDTEIVLNIPLEEEFFI